LQTTHERYDLITGEPPPPKLAGIGNLYTRQFFGLVRDRLNDGGIVTYYFPVHLLTPADARAVLRAFCDVFPNCSLWNGYGDDWMMVGVRGTLPRAEERQFAGVWERPPSASQLVDIGIETPEQLGALFIADAPTLRAWIGDAAPLEDNYPGRLSGLIPSAQEVRYLRSLADARAARGLFESSEFIRATWPETLRERSAPYFETQQALNNVWDVPGHDRFFSDLHRVLTSTRLRTVPLLLLGSEPRYHEIARLVQADEEGVPALAYRNGIGALAEREFERAAQLFAAARQGDPSLKRVGLYQVFALACANRTAEARAALSSLSAAERTQASAANLAWLTAFAGGSAVAPAVTPQ
jgi:hypothetical protein